MYFCKYCAFIIIENRISNHHKDAHVRAHTHSERKTDMLCKNISHAEKVSSAVPFYVLCWAAFCSAFANIQTFAWLNYNVKNFLPFARSLTHARARITSKCVSIILWSACKYITTCSSNIFLSNFIRWKTFLFYICALCVCVQCFCNGKMMKWYFAVCLSCQTGNPSKCKFYVYSHTFTRALVPSLYSFRHQPPLPPQSYLLREKFSIDFDGIV